MERSREANSSEELFDVLGLLARLDEIRENKKIEFEKFIKKISPEKAEIFNDLSDTDKCAVIAIWKMSDTELVSLCRHAKEVEKFGFHNARAILNDVDLFTENSPDLAEAEKAKRYHIIAEEIGREKLGAQNIK